MICYMLNFRTRKLALSVHHIEHTSLCQCKHFAIEKPSNKLPAAADLKSDNCPAKGKRVPGKKPPLNAAGVQGLRAEYTRKE